MPVVCERPRKHVHTQGKKPNVVYSVDTELCFPRWLKEPEFEEDQLKQDGFIYGRITA